jgi:hypothetical protein
VIRFVVGEGEFGFPGAATSAIAGIGPRPAQNRTGRESKDDRRKPPGNINLSQARKDVPRN